MFQQNTKTFIIFNAGAINFNHAVVAVKYHTSKFTINFDDLKIISSEFNQGIEISDWKLSQVAFLNAS